ncbi:MAG: HD domain-containing phosphohydrolase [Acidobacteriota bacterium]
MNRTKEAVRIDWTPVARRTFRAVTVLGSGVVLLAVTQAVGRTAGGEVGWLVLVLLATVLGHLSAEIPGDRTYITPSETIAFLAILLYGPAIATVVGTVDAFVAVRRQRGSHLYSAVFSTAVMAISLYASGLAYQFSGGASMAGGLPRAVWPIVAPLVAMAVVHYVINTGLVALMVSQRRDGSAGVVSTWAEAYGFAGVTYLASAWVAVLIVLTAERFGWASIFASLPLVGGIVYINRLHTSRMHDLLSYRDQITAAYQNTVMTLAQAIDARDDFGRGHVFRVKEIAIRIAKRIGMDPAGRESLATAALLHDIGKLAVPDYVLNKRGALNAVETELVSTHPTVGAELLVGVHFPRPVLPAVRHHHEAWDGTGYPDGLAGEAIPLEGRILAVADNYEMLRCSGAHRPGLPAPEALQVMEQGTGRKFDPTLVRALQSCAPAIESAREADVEWGDWRPGSESQPALQIITSIQRNSQAVLEALQDLGGTLDLGETMEVLADHIRRRVPGVTGVLYLVHSSGNRLEAAHVWGAGSELLIGHRIARGTGLAGQVLATGEAVLDADPALDLIGVDPEVSGRYRSGSALPLCGVDGVIEAVIGLYDTEEGTRSADVAQWVAQLSRKAAEAIRNARLFAEMQSAMPADNSSALPDEATTHARLAADLASSREQFIPLSLLAVRLRGVEAVEQRSGPLVRRQLLAEVASLVRRQAEPADHVGWGPDGTLIVIGFGTARQEAGILAERIDQEISALRCVVAGGQISGVDPAIGMAHHPEDGEEAQALLDLALDRASAVPVRRHDGTQTGVVNLRLIRPGNALRDV